MNGRNFRAVLTVMAVALIVGSPLHAGRCLRAFYPSIQQGNSNIVQPWHTIDYYRAKVVADWGFEAVKVWDRWYGPANGQFARLISDPAVDVIVYRPLYQSGAPVNQFPKWENIDYGSVASEIYQFYGALDKVVILTGWEQDHQFYHSGGAMTAPQYLQMLNDRQQGVEAARAAYPGAALRVYHAIEVNIVPNAVNYGSQNVLHQFIPNMTSPPDMISYSAWGGLSNIATKLNVIQAVSGLARDNIFIGEFGFNINNTSHSSVSNFIGQARNWGVRLTLLWQFNQGYQTDPHSVYRDPGVSGGAGYTTEPGTGIPIALNTITAVQNHRDFTKACRSYW